MLNTFYKYSFSAIAITTITLCLVMEVKISEKRRYDILADKADYVSVLQAEMEYRNLAGYHHAHNH